MCMNLYLYMYVVLNMDLNNGIRIKGVARGKGGNSPPPETEKIVVEKWCDFRRLYF